MKVVILLNTLLIIGVFSNYVFSDDIAKESASYSYWHGSESGIVSGVGYANIKIYFNGELMWQKNKMKNSDSFGGNTVTKRHFFQMISR